MAKTMFVSLLVGLLFLAFAPEESHGMMARTLTGKVAKAIPGLRCGAVAFRREASGVPKIPFGVWGDFIPRAQPMAHASALVVQQPMVQQPMVHKSVFQFVKPPTEILTPNGDGRVCAPNGNDWISAEVEKMITGKRIALRDAIENSFVSTLRSYTPPPDIDECDEFGVDVGSVAIESHSSDYEGSEKDFSPQELADIASTYDELSPDKAQRYAHGIRKAVTRMTHAGDDSTPVKTGMIIEGTVKWKGCMCDIGVPDGAATVGGKVLEAVNGFLGANPHRYKTKEYVDEEITRAQMAVRMVFVNHAPEDMEDVCNVQSMRDARIGNEKVDLTEYMQERTGDCRMNNLLLALLIEPLADAGLITDVNYRNRKWGLKENTDPLSIGDKAEQATKDWKDRDSSLYGQKSQGEHTLLSFKYGSIEGAESDVEYTLDAYARQHDRLPLRDIDDIYVPDEAGTMDGGWYAYPESSLENNAWARLADSGMLELILPKMTAFSKSRFSDQTLIGTRKDTKVYALFERENYPKIAYTG